MSMRRAIIAAATALVARPGGTGGRPPGKQPLRSRPIRWRLLPSGAIAAVLVAAGCAPGSTPSGGTAPSANGIGPITFAVGEDDANIFAALIEPWNRANPSQRVTLMRLPEAENG